MCRRNSDPRSRTPIEPMPDLVNTDMERYEQVALFIGLVGVAGSIAGFVLNRNQFFQSYLFSYIFWLGMALGCLGLVLLNHVVGGKWGLVIRRFLEVGSLTLPVMALLIVPILFGLSSLYLWSDAAVVARDEVLQKKTSYLNVPFFLGRVPVYFAIWCFYAIVLNRLSATQDRTGDESLIERMKRISAPGLVIFTVTTTFAFVDWVMSLEPHWYSTIYGLMFLIGQVLQALALMISMLILFSDRQPLRDTVTPQHLHDLGNLILTFTVLWAYLSFSQFLIIWAGNLPEEIPWYLTRLRGGWNVIAVMLILFHFAVPFIVLLQREAKRRARILLRICVAMIAVRIIDVFWVVVPGLRPNGFAVHWMDLATFLAIGGIWLGLFFRRLKSRPLLLTGDPRLAGPPREMVTY